MVLTITGIRDWLLGTRPWVLAAAVLGLVLLGLYLVLGMQYVTASRDTSSLEGEIERLGASIRSTSRVKGSLSEATNLAQPTLESLGASFPSARRDELMMTLLAAADANGVSLRQLALSDPQSPDAEGGAYQVQPATAMLQGETSGIIDFLSYVGKQLPGTRIADLGLSGLEGAPTAQLRLFFTVTATTDTLPVGQGE